MDYRKTLNLLQTDFPLKGNLPAARAGDAQVCGTRWTSTSLVRRSRQGAPKYVLHDGPPYANGNIHLGQALNKILKDIAIKYKTHARLRLPLRPRLGHPGPADRAERRSASTASTAISVPPLRVARQVPRAGPALRGPAARAVPAPRRPRRLGPSLPDAQPAVPGPADRGLRQDRRCRAWSTARLRPVYWCYHCETALAEDEIEYATKSSPAIYVAFKLRGRRRRSSRSCPPGATRRGRHLDHHAVDPPGQHRASPSAPATSTCWPAAGSRYLSSSRGPARADRGRLRPGRRARSWPRRRAGTLEGLVAVHPLYDRPSPLVLADYVAMDQGTGRVHTAPGHGLEDFQTALRYEPAMSSARVDDYGPLHRRGRRARWPGKVCDQANDDVIGDARRGRRAAERRARSSTSTRTAGAATCRSSTAPPSSGSWTSTSSAPPALEEIEQAEWMPAWGESRIAGMVRGAARLVHLPPARLGRADPGLLLRRLRARCC